MMVFVLILYFLGHLHIMVEKWKRGDWCIFDVFSVRNCKWIADYVIVPIQNKNKTINKNKWVI